MGAEALPWSLFAVKLGLYTSALLASGLSLHAGLGIIEDAARRQVVALATGAAALAALSAVIRLVLTNAQLAGGLENAFDWATLSWAWAVQAPSLLALCGSVISFAAFLMLGKQTLLILGALLIAVSFAVTGHTQALPAPGLAPAAVAIHVLIASFWFAAPISLWPPARFADESLLARVESFSAWAVFTIPILLGLGVWLLLLLGGNAVLSSLYGQLLLAKLAIATLAVALGAANKFWVTGLLRRSPLRGRAALKSTLSADACIFTAALVLVAWATTLTGPPSST